MTSNSEVRPDVKITQNNCRHCNKKLCDRKSRWKHEQICKEKKPNEEISELKNMIKEQQNQIAQLLNVIKVHPKKIQKINNQINNNVNNINNGTINIVVPLGSEKFYKVLSDDQKYNILKNKDKAALKFIEMIYNEPELEKYRNVYVTNMSNDIAYIYDDKAKKFIVDSKDKIINNYGENRYNDMEEFIDEFKEKFFDKLSEKTLHELNDLFEKYFNDEEYKKQQNKKILMSLYNNRSHVESNYNIQNKKADDKEIEL